MQIINKPNLQTYIIVWCLLVLFYNLPGQQNIILPGIHISPGLDYPVYNTLFTSIDKNYGIWMCTSEGLIRYNGKEFTYVTNGSQWAAESMMSIHQSSNGKTIAFTFKNDLIEYSQNKISLHPLAPQIKSIFKDNRIFPTQILVDKNDVLYFAHRDGAFKIDTNNQVIHFPREKPGVHIVQDSNVLFNYYSIPESLWLNIPKTDFFLNGKRVCSLGEVKGNLNYWAYAIPCLKISNDEFVLFYYQYVIKIVNGKLANIFKYNQLFRWAEIDNNGRIFFITDQHRFGCFDPKEFNIKFYTDQLTEFSAVRFALKDNIVYFPLGLKGIYHIPNLEIKSMNVPILSNGQARQYNQQGEYADIVGKELLFYDKENRIIDSYKFSKEDSADRILIHVSQDRKTLYGATHKYIFILENRKIRKIKLGNYLYNYTQLFYKNSQLFIYNYKGLFKILGDSLSNCLLDGLVQKDFPLKDGSFIIYKYPNFYYHFRKENDSLKILNDSLLKDTRVIFGNNINHFYSFSTSNGAHFYNGKVHKKLSINNEITLKKLNFIGELPNNEFLLWDNFNLFLINEKGDAITNKNIEKYFGLSGLGSIQIIDSGIIWANQKNQFLIKNEWLKHNPAIHLTPLGIYASNAQQNIITLNTSDTSFNLPVHFNNFTIHFELMDGLKKSHSRYYYRLIGHQNHWQKSETGTLHYDNIASGNYIFEAKSCEWDSCSLIYRLFINIPPPWYKSRWFWAIIILSLSSIIALLIRMRIKSIKSRFIEQIEHVELKQKLLSAQLNPHFLFNALNSVQGFLVSNDKKSSIEFLAKFSKLLRTFTENSNKNYISLKEELTIITNYLELEQSRFNNFFTFNLIIDPDINIDETLIPVSILQPIVENSIKHGIWNLENRDGSNIIISFERLKDQLQIMVKDNGVGFGHNHNLQNSRYGHSIALNLIQERLQLYKTIYNTSFELTIEGRPIENYPNNHGTDIKIILPIINLNETSRHLH